jgi:transposase
MDPHSTTIHPTFVFHQIPTAVSRRDFNRSINPHLHRRHQGPKPKLSLFKIFNYILYVLHTGMQWAQLKTKRTELHDTNVYKWHNRWSKDGSYQRLFEASIIQLQRTDQLDTSVLHGDGSNTVVKKGASVLATRAISTRKGRKNSRSWTTMVL